MSHLGEQELRSAALGPAARAHLADCPVCEWRAAGLGAVAHAAVAAREEPRVPDFDRLLGPALARKPLRRNMSWRESGSLAGQLLRAQWLLLPRALALTGMLGYAAVAALALGLRGATGGDLFGALASLLLLLGVVWGGEPERGRHRELTLTLPVSPAAVFLTRLTLVLGLGLGLALAGSVLVWAAGQPVALPALVAGWFGPSLLSAAVATVLSVWRAPWLGLAGGVLVWTAGWVLTRLEVLHPGAGLAAALRLLWPTTPVTLAVAMALFALAARLVAGRGPRLAGAG